MGLTLHLILLVLSILSSSPPTANSSPLNLTHPNKLSIGFDPNPISRSQAGSTWPFNPLPSLNWFTEGTLTIVDRQPAIQYVTRQAMFGPRFDEYRRGGREREDEEDEGGMLMGYLIPLQEFLVPCKGNGTLIERGNEGVQSKIRKWLNPHRSPIHSTSTESTPADLACTPLCLPTPSSPHPASTDTWIALVHRGQCAFATKIRQAQRWGAKAVVVGGFDEDMINMYSQEDTSDITIPSTYIPLSSLSHLSSLLTTSNTTLSHLPTLSILLSFPPSSSFPWYSPLLTFAFLLLLPSLLTLVTLGVHRVRMRRARRRERASRGFVGGLPWRVWGGEGWEKWGDDGDGEGEGEGESSNGGVILHTTNPPSLSDSNHSSPSLPSPPSPSPAAHTPSPPITPSPAPLPPSTPQTNGSPLPPWYRLQSTCPICLSPYSTGDRIRILPCLHIFHLEEVDEWLVRRKKLCPVCKADITKSGHSSTPSSSPTPSTATPSTIVNSPISGIVDADADISVEEIESRPTERTALLPLPRSSNSNSNSDLDGSGGSRIARMGVWRYFGFGRGVNVNGRNSQSEEVI